MKRIVALFVILAFFSVSLSGCATTSNAGQKAGAGAVIGGIAGAILGGLVGRSTKGVALGAAIGAAVGGVTGYIIGKYEDRQVYSKKSMYEEYPEYGSKGSNLKPKIEQLQAVWLDDDGQPLTAFPANKKITMIVGSSFVIVAPPNVATVKVKEVDWIYGPNGLKKKVSMKHDEPYRVYHDEHLEVVHNPHSQIGPLDGLLPGKYTHVAIVTIEGVQEEFRSTPQEMVVAQTRYGMRIYAAR